MIVARITGFGQTGELAHRAGRELNYVSMTGKDFQFVLFFIAYNFSFSFFFSSKTIIYNLIEIN